MPRLALHDVAIIASYNTQQQKRLENTSELDLVIEIIQALLDKSGLDATAIDGININSPVWNLKPREALQFFGARPGWCGNEFMGIAAVLEAAGAIATGQADTVMIASAQCGEYQHGAATAPWTRPSHEFSECFGLYTAAEFALSAQRHIALYDTPLRAMAEAAATIRNHGHQHPQAAHFGKPAVSADDVLASRPVATPFNLLDCCITSEGGGGLLLTRADLARELEVTPTYLLGAGTDRQGLAYTRAPVWDVYGQVGARAAQRSFEQAGLSPADVDVAEFYDPFSFEILRQLECFGFCEPGEAATFVLDGNTAIDGRLPVSTNGGLLAFGHAGTVQMLQKVIAAHEQLIGDVPAALNVEHAQVALASNGGSGALFSDVMLLGLEQAA